MLGLEWSARCFWVSLVLAGRSGLPELPRLRDSQKTTQSVFSEMYLCFLVLLFCCFCVSLYAGPMWIFGFHPSSLRRWPSPQKTILVTQTHTIRAIDQCKFSYRRCSGRLGCLVRWDGAHVWRRWWAWGTGMQGGTDKPWRDAASRSSPGSLRLLPPTSLVLPLGVCLLLVAGLLVATL